MRLCKVLTGRRIFPEGRACPAGPAADRVPSRKREVNPRKNIVWDSGANPVHVPPVDLGERVMYEKTLVFTALLAASLTNVVCLVGHL